MKILYVVMFILQLLVYLSCNLHPVEHMKNISEMDLRPPKILSIDTANTKQITIALDEPGYIHTPNCRIFPDIRPAAIVDGSSNICIECSTETQIGRKYTLSAIIEDKHKNSLRFLVDFYGYNPEIPDLCINEFTTQGSGNHPDVVELYVRKRGNMGGLCLYEGTDSNWEQRYIFPEMEVTVGDYIVVHFKPQGIDTEINETYSKSASGGKDASDTAYDFWVKEGTGLSGNNGVISLYTRPKGTLIDGVAYSNRTSESDTRYDGFGSNDTRERITELYQCGGWLINGEKPRPEDAIDPTDSTSTRSMCRNSRSSDTNSKGDWHITPTRGSTFGSKNTDEVYE